MTDQHRLRCPIVTRLNLRWPTRPLTSFGSADAIPLALAIVATLCVLPRCLPAQDPNPLEGVAFLAGGTWQGEGRWPDGTAMRVDVRYFWGPTRRVLHFETYDLETGERRLLYEGLILFDPSRRKLVQWMSNPRPDSVPLSHREMMRGRTQRAGRAGKAPLPGPDRLHWADPRGTAAGQPTRQQGRREQQECHAGNGARIGGSHAEQQPLQPVRCA